MSGQQPPYGQPHWDHGRQPPPQQPYGYAPGQYGGQPGYGQPAGWQPDPGVPVEQACTVTTGFYLLSRCTKLGDSQCTQCGRRICILHGIREVDGVFCPECYVQQGREVPPTSRSWALQYRRRYRTEAGDRLQDPGIWWSFDRYDRYRFAAGMGGGGGGGGHEPDDYDEDEDFDIFDS